MLVWKIASWDDYWIALVRDDKIMLEGHSFTLRMGLEAMGVESRFEKVTYNL